MKRLIPHAFPPVKLNGQQLQLRFGYQDKEIHFFVRCPDCTRVIEIRCAADGDYGIILEMLNTTLGRWGAQS